MASQVDSCVHLLNPGTKEMELNICHCQTMISLSISTQALVYWNNIWIRSVEVERTTPVYWLKPEPELRGEKGKDDTPASAIIMPEGLSLQCAS